jgi:1-deoxy-D-xylulose-5-phosphate synthase
MNNSNILDRINSPEELKQLSKAELPETAGAIRQLLLDTVSANGGHLAPNLGVVELSLALHYVFDTPEDKLVWDVGHQAYVHKIITGRKDFFKTLRQHNGCSGFLSRQESEFDTFGAGHAGTALSAATGMAAARDSRDSNEHIVAVVGDGSIGCGISLEALNNIKTSCKRLIIVLNDNKMSISENVGAISRHLSHIIAGQRYNRLKKWTKKWVEKLPCSEKIMSLISRIEESTKGILVPGMLFEEFGIRYIGPIDGHDINELISTLQGVKEFSSPVIVHVITEKGRGYSPAESAPEKFHGLGCFNPATGEKTADSPPTTFSNAFGESMVEMAQTHPKLIAITAGMTAGTGLTSFAEKFPKQFYDVGIAEEHAVVFAAGLAASGYRPVVAIYATFIQRALDCIYHDVCLQNLPVIFCLDRAGVVEDGPTHHGLYDLPFMLTIPNLAVLAPKNEIELDLMLKSAYDYNAPVAIRYPRGWSGSTAPEKPVKDIVWGKAELVKDGSDVAIWSTGREINTALKVADILSTQFSLKAKVINTRFLAPFDHELLLEFAEKMPIATIEDSVISGGLGTVIDELLINVKHRGIKHFGWGKQFINHGAPAKLREEHNFTPEKIAEAIAAL